MKNFKLSWIIDTIISYIIFIILVILTSGIENFFENFFLLIFFFLIGTIIYDAIFKSKEYRFNALRAILYMKFKNHNKSKKL